MQHLILLHGAIGAKDQMEPLSTRLQESYIVHTLNFSGHGGKAFPKNGFSISSFADDLLAYLRENKIEHTNIFGYSMGGYVAMYVAKYYPQLINKIITLATKFSWSEEVSAREIKLLDPNTIIEKVPAFARQLEKRHTPNDWRLVLEKTKEMLLQLGKKNELNLDDYQKILTPALLLLGGKDKMITIDETVAVQQAMPNAKFKLLPDTLHPIEQVNPELICGFLVDFLSDR
jgi:pimeloyl-ACP methyl ester carboxylesterase